MPLLYEWLVSETRGQFVERSLISGCFCGHYTQGVMATLQKEPLRLSLSLNDGLGAVNSAWNADAGGAMAQTGRVEGVAVTGRAEWRITGDWKQYDDFEGWPNDKPLVVLGAAAHWQQGEFGTSGTRLSTGDDPQIIRWTIDASLERGGANLFLALIGNHLSEAQGVPDLNEYAALAQGGWFLRRDVELVARYEWGDLDVPEIEDLHLVTIGVTKFFASKHQIKWMTDIGYAFNPLNRASVGGNTFGWPIDFAGWRPDAQDSDGQFVFRTQLQLLY
jgi:hypothetical protein